MKIAFGFLLISVAAFASDQDQKEKYFKTNNSYKTTYVRFGSTAMLVDDSYLIAPSINAGWQYRENKQGVDISMSGAKGNKETKEALSFNLPKVQYLAFLQDNKSSNKHNAYLGLGGSLYGMNIDEEKKNEAEEIVKERTQEYTGLAASASVGYSYNLGKKIQSSIQLGATMPTPLAFNSKGDVYKPSFELNIGLGF